MVYASKALTIKQDKDSIIIKYDKDSIIDHIIDFLTDKQVNFKHTNETITIPCSNCKTLVDYQKDHKHVVPYQNVVNICLTLSPQLKWLHQRNYVINQLYRKDVIVLDNSFALYVGVHHIEPLTDNSTSIPENIYTFGVLLIKLLFNKDITKEKYKPEKVIEPLYYTPLYWSITRMIDKSPDNRVLVYI